MKTCKLCNLEKTLDQFARNAKMKDGCLNECKECNKIYRQANAKRRAAVELKRRRKLGVKAKVVLMSDEQRRRAHIEACRRWQCKNDVKVKEYEALYREANKSKRYQQIAAWRKENKARINAWSNKRRAQVMRNTPVWADFEKIVAIYQEAQLLTEQTGIEHHVDHFFPIHGKTVCGLHVHENLRVITWQENLQKGNKHPDDL